MSLNNLKVDQLPLNIINKGSPVKGLLFIGDPHIFNGNIGLRRDISFFKTSLDKLEQAVKIANDNNLYTVILGDFFHKEENRSENVYINNVITVLKKFNRTPVTIIGNHEKTEWILTSKDALSVLNNADKIDIMYQNGFFGIIEIINDEGEIKRVALGGTPYGQPIPYDLCDFIGMEGGKTFREDEEIKLFLEAVEKNNGKKDTALVTEAPKTDSNETLHEKIKQTLMCDDVVWITHHDLAFEGHYPTSRPLHPIDGVDMMINGHIHDTKKPVKVGLTTCYNPGNITRLSIDMDKHIPSVWSWTPFDNEGMSSSQGVKVPKLQQHILKFAPPEEVFNYEGRHTRVSYKLNDEETKSSFVRLLLNDQMSKKTHEAVAVKESIQTIKENDKEGLFNQEVLAIIDNLFNTVIKEEQENVHNEE